MKGKGALGSDVCDGVIDVRIKQCERNHLCILDRKGVIN